MSEQRAALGGQVVCLGDIMIDIQALLPGPLALGSDTPAPVRFGHGGSAANTASWLAWLGAPVLLVGRVGADAAGREALRLLIEQGVRTRFSIDPDAPTGVCLVLVTPDGERTMIPSAGANATLRPAHLSDPTQPPLLTGADRLHVSGYTLLAGGSRQAARYALQLAADNRVPVSVDVASAALIRQLGGSRLLGWLPAGALVLANAEELAALVDTEASDPSDGPARCLDAAARLVADGFTVVMKDGPRGALVGWAGGLQPVPTEPVPVLDSTGAGDAFAAGMLAALHRGAGLLEAAREGNRAGARAVTGIGGRPGSRS